MSCQCQLIGTVNARFLFFRYVIVVVRTNVGFLSSFGWIVIVVNNRFVVNFNQIYADSKKCGFYFEYQVFAPFVVHTKLTYFDNSVVER